MRDNPVLTYAQALEVYFGGIKQLQKQPIPFTCIQCHGEAWNMQGIWEHIRKEHKERIKKVKKQ